MAKDKTPPVRVNCRILRDTGGSLTIEVILNPATTPKKIETFIPMQFVRSFSKGRPDGSGGYVTMERWIAEDRGIIEKPNNMGVRTADGEDEEGDDAC